MKIITISLKRNLILILLSSLSLNQAKAASEIISLKKAKTVHTQNKPYSKQLSEKQKYHGVFYGVLPCKDCVGTKVTLSLKNRNNYLLVTQPAKNSAREYFDKGKYTWDDKTKTVTLTSRKKSVIQKFQIIDEETLTKLSPEGMPMKTNQKNTSYILHQKETEQRKSLMHIQ